MQRRCDKAEARGQRLEAEVKEAQRRVKTLEAQLQALSSDLVQLRDREANLEASLVAAQKQLATTTAATAGLSRNGAKEPGGGGDGALLKKYTDQLRAVQRELESTQRAAEAGEQRTAALSEELRSAEAAVLERDELAIRLQATTARLVGMQSENSHVHHLKQVCCRKSISCCCSSRSSCCCSSGSWCCSCCCCSCSSRCSSNGVWIVYG